MIHGLQTTVGLALRTSARAAAARARRTQGVYAARASSRAAAPGSRQSVSGAALMGSASGRSPFEEGVDARVLRGRVLCRMNHSSVGRRAGREFRTRSSLCARVRDAAARRAM